MRRAVALALALAPGAALAEPGDVPWYVQNPAERRAKLEWCAADAARQDTRECMNARAAGAVELMSPDPWARLRAFEGPSRPATPPPPPPAPKPSGPAVKGPARGA